MKKIFLTLCALLVSAVLSHSVNNSALAHDATTDSVEPVELGSVFQFSVEDKVTRQVCTKVEYIDMALTDIAKMSPRKAHHFLFHDAVRKSGTGTQKLKRGYSGKTEQAIIEHCKGLGPTKFAPVKVIKEMNIHGYKVSIASIYESYKDKEGIFYTWFVNTEFAEPSTREGTQTVRGQEKIFLGKKIPVYKGLYTSTDLDVIHSLLAAINKQPPVVGRTVLRDPMTGYMGHDFAKVFVPARKLKVMNSLFMDFEFDFEVVETKIIHDLPVAILALKAVKTYYTWIVGAEVIDRRKGALAK
jgi:hypothetical protein